MIATRGRSCPMGTRTLRHAWTTRARANSVVGYVPSSRSPGLCTHPPCSYIQWLAPKVLSFKISIKTNNRLPGVTSPPVVRQGSSAVGGVRMPTDGARVTTVVRPRGRALSVAAAREHSFTPPTSPQPPPGGPSTHKDNPLPSHSLTHAFFALFVSGRRCAK